MAGPQKIAATVSKVITHLPDVKTLLLTPQRRAPKFKPGQFLHLAIDPYDPSMHWPESRVFSICSAPESRNEIRITFSKVGKFTTRMMELKEGDEVWLKFPYGDFVIEGDKDAQNILIAGGTGITPFMSWIWSMQNNDCNANIIYGVRSPNHFIYDDDLNQACRKIQNLKWFPFIETGEYPGAIKERLNVDRIFEVCDLEANANRITRYYISGPPGMIESIQTQLKHRGVHENQILIDAW